jgi:hypothetical protein
MISRVAEALLETAADLHRLGLMDDVAYRRIVMRHKGEGGIAGASNCMAEIRRGKHRKARLA